MSTTSPEIVRWKYRARELQTTAILNEAEDGIDVEVAANAEQFKRLDALLCTSPILLDSVIKNFHESRDQFYGEATTAVRILAKRFRILSVLTKFAQACEGEASGTREITIDSVDLTTPLPIKQIFKDKGEVLEQTIAEGHEEAAKKLLTLTQGEIPLMRYRRDLAIQKFSLSSTLDHGLLGYIPTKIEGVDLRLWYPRADTLPRLSFMVKPFEVEV